MLAMTVDEIAEMLGSREYAQELASARTDNLREAIASYVKHMRASGFICGHEWGGSIFPPDSPEDSQRYHGD
jgi:hypothetical protein